MDTVGVYENRKVVIESEGNGSRAEDFRHEALVVGATELQGMAISVGGVQAKTALR